MSHPRQPASELLPLLIAAFPRTFFAEPKQVRPLKVNIHRDLEALLQANALPAALDRLQLQRLLRWYTRQTSYLQALARGEGRIDLTGAVVATDIPPPIRHQAHQAVECRRSRPAARGEFRSASAVALLPTLAAAFPQTFFPEPAQVQPLKVFLYRDLLQLAKAGALPDGIDPTHLKPFLRWYSGRTSYLKALAQGAGRIDLAGTVVATEIPTAIRQRAREEVQRRRQAQATRSSTPAEATPLPAVGAAVPTAHPVTTLHLEDLYAMAIDAKLELTLKFSTLPTAQSAGPGKLAFALKTQDGQYVTVEVSNKVWNKLVKANTDWSSWIAALSGTMGARTEKGFTLANPGLQVFEKKVKTADAPVPAASAPAPVPSPPPTAPVTITTGAGTATVTVTKRSTLGLQRDASPGGAHTGEMEGS
jgi:sRNA-binding protein